MRRLGLAMCAVILAFCCSPLLARAQVNIELNPDPGRAGVHFESDPKDAIAKARGLVAAGDLAGAIRGLATYVAAHPNEADPARLLGDLYYRQGDLKTAELTYRAILAIYPKDKQTHNRLGTVLATENRIDDAISEFNASLPGTDSVPDLVVLHQRKGDLAEYRKGLERLASDYPTDADIQSEAGEMYASLHLPTEAVLMFRRALDNSPNNLTALNGLGMAEMDLHDYKSALNDFDRCRGIDPTSYACLDNQGATYLEMGRWDDAQQVLTLARNVAPEMPQALVNFGYLADARNDWKNAVAWYVKALAMSPFSRDAYIDLGIEYRDHQLYPQAEAVLIKGIAVAPEDGRLHELLGETYEVTGKRDLAIAQYRAAEACLDPMIVAIAKAHFEALANRPAIHYRN